MAKHCPVLVMTVLVTDPRVQYEVPGEHLNRIEVERSGGRFASVQELHDVGQAVARTSPDTELTLLVVVDHDPEGDRAEDQVVSVRRDVA